MADRRSRWQRWRSLDGRDRRRLSGLVLLLPMIDIGLRLAGLKRTQAVLDRLSNADTRPGSPDRLADAERLAQLASIAGRHGLYPNTCLRQALAVRWWLRRDGMPAHLRLGTIKRADTLDAHAWVELDGVALAQADLTYTAFPGL